MRVAFRFRVSSQDGYGHAMRSVALAEELSRQVGARVKFFASGDEPARKWLAGLGWQLELHEQDGRAGLEQVLDFSPDVLVWDQPGNVPATELARTRDSGVVSVLIDNLGSARLQADLCFVPTEGSDAAELWASARGGHFCGPHYALVRRSISLVKPPMPTNAYRVMMTTGGSDPDGVALKLIDALEQVRQPLLVDLVVGFGFQRFAALAARLATVEGMYFCHFGVRDMAALMRRAHLAVAAYGSVVYELAAAGLPTVLVARNRKHAREAADFCKLGSAVSLGQIDGMKPESLASVVEELCGNRQARVRMCEAGKVAVDGKGVRRVAKEITRWVKLRRCGEKAVAGMDLGCAGSTQPGLSPC